MTVRALDHVNIITADLDGSAAFYAEVFGLERRDGPMPRDLGQWIYDGEGRAIIHLNHVDCPRHFDRDVAPGPTGALHHVALACSGFDRFKQRFDDRGLAYRENAVESIGLRQLFVQDPNQVLLELNFSSD